MKQFVSVDPNTRERTVVAQFELEGDTVKVTYIDPKFARYFRFDRIRSKSGTLTPADGRAFYDALDGAFAHNSLCHVRDA